MAKVAKNVPTSFAYHPDYTLTESSKFTKIGFGIGQRMTPQ
jgi:hypothetical protein